MEVVKLPIGQRAAPESDCVSIQELPSGEFALNCSALRECGEGEDAESQAMIGGKPYATYEDAEAAGLAWANERGVQQLYVSRSVGANELPELP